MNIKKYFLILPIVLSLSGCSPLSVTDMIPYDSGSDSFVQEMPDNMNTDGTMQVYFIDCGQGDAILATCDGQTLLIDSGPNTASVQVTDFLDSHEITTINYHVVTHPHEDHLGNSDDIIRNYDVKNVITTDVTTSTNAYESFLTAVSEKNIPFEIAVPGTSYSLGSASFTIVAPVKEYEDLNNSSVGLKLTLGTMDYLFLGDAEAEAVEDIIDSGADLNCEVYKVSHHGSYTSTTDKLIHSMSNADFHYAVISCGIVNEYGHPHQECIASLMYSDFNIFRTDMQGDISSSTDGTTITFDKQPYVFTDISYEEPKLERVRREVTASFSN